MSEKITKGKQVELNYTIQDQTGEIIEHSSLPVNYIHGEKSGLFEKIEQALENKQVGDMVEVLLSPKEGFGLHDKSLTFTDKIENVPPQFRQLGAEVEFKNDQGDVKKFNVTKIENGQLTVDGNHPFAGKTVTFFVKVMGIK